MLDNNFFMFHYKCNMTYKTPQLAKILQVSERKLIDWCEKGIILADIQEADGYASRREFSYRGILRAGLALALKDNFRIPRDFIKSIVASLWLRGFFSEWEQGESGFLSIANPHDPVRMTWYYLPSDFSSDYKAWGWLWKNIEAFLVIDLGPIKERIDRELSAIT